ncbi:response regulator [Roseisolibacter agri]|uniref:Response regulator n=1 Tax=Roseisolibacter agri TaxID=2014610 RepID=A0AA37V1X6_9BACT|nr:response regulator [Roseisolibacter agri]GLC26950.1 response regulator [Roseisolibacter agri]
MASPRTTIAVVEDDAGVRTALRQLLRSAQFDALTFASAEELLSARRATAIDCLVADVNLPGMSGVALLRALDARGEAVPAVLVTGRDDPGTQELLRQAGPVPRLHKPFTDDALFEAIRAAMQG